MVMSAVSSVSTPGVLVTVMPRATAAATSMLSTPLPKLAISLSRRPASRSTGAVDPVGDGRNQHVGGPHRLGEVGLAHRLVVVVEPGVEQLAHPRFDALGQLSCDDHQRLLRFRHGPAPRRRPAARSKLVNRAGRHSEPPISVGGGRLLSIRRAFQDKAPVARPFRPRFSDCVAHETCCPWSVVDAGRGMGRQLRPRGRTSPARSAGCRSRASSA